VEKLSLAIATILYSNGASKITFEDRNAREVRLRALLDKYSSTFAPDLSSVNKQPVNNGELFVVLTGSTGSLGSYLLDRILAHPRVAKIYCLNRSSNSKERQIQTASFPKLDTNLSTDRVEFLHGQCGKPSFELDVEKYKELLETTTHIVHNAWAVNFNLAVESFESSHIYGVREPLDFSAASSKAIHIFFISSISSVTNWPVDHEGPVPERVINDSRVAEMNGYGESKHIAELLLDVGYIMAGITSSILRIGQIGGPIKSSGVWNKQEWLPSLIRSSKYLGLLPQTIGAMNEISWQPVDILADIILEILDNSLDQAVDKKTKVYNATNPHVTAWANLAPVVQKLLSTDNSPVKIVPYAS
jgi:thioester reductase-like protein